MMATAETLSCGHAPTPTYYTAGTRLTVGGRTITMTGEEVMFPGYAVLEDGRRVCPDCADGMQRQDMQAAERFTAYTSSDGRRITTWTGGTLAVVTRRTDNGRQTYLRARDPQGGEWSGRGPSGTGVYVRLRRIGGKS